MGGRVNRRESKGKGGQGRERGRGRVKEKESKEENLRAAREQYRERSRRVR